MSFNLKNIYARALMTGALYGLSIYLASLIIFPVINAPVIWSVNAFPAAILLFNRRKCWPLILFFCAMGQGVAGLAIPSIAWESYLLLCVVNLFEISLLAFIIRKVAGKSPTKYRLKPFIITGLWATAFATLISAVLSVVLFTMMADDLPFLQTILRVFTSGFLGQLLLLPTVIYYVVLDRTSLKKMLSGEVTQLTLMWGILFLIIAATLVSLNSATPLHYIFPYLTFPVIVWIALRYGIRLTLTFSIIASIFTKYLAARGYAPFGHTAYATTGQVIEINIALIAQYGTLIILAMIAYDQKKVKQDLARREEWFEIAINHMSGGLYLLDKKRRFKVLSTNLQRKFDLPEEICCLGAHIKQVFKFRAVRGDYGAGDPDEFVALRMAELEELKTTHGQNSPSSGRTYEYSQNHTKDDEIIVIYHDITERIRAEKDSNRALIEAQKANKAKTDFLANMSHELRTPLNAIIGFSEIMTKDHFAEASADKVREYSNDIHMSGRHLLQIINDILDLSKIEAGMLDIKSEEIYLEEYIRECVTFITLRAAEAGIELSNSVENTSQVILADGRMFKQIMINILSNAVKFTPRGGHIDIAHKVNPDGQTIITVTDSGIGIDEDDIEAVMEPFKQADSSLSREFEGTGLGLPLAKSLMELHGGTLTLKSQAGCGTTVSLNFPPHHTANNMSPLSPELHNDTSQSI